MAFLFLLFRLFCHLQDCVFIFKLDLNLNLNLTDNILLMANNSSEVIPAEDLEPRSEGVQDAEMQIVRRTPNGHLSDTHSEREQDAEMPTVPRSLDGHLELPEHPSGDQSTEHARLLANTPMLGFNWNRRETPNRNGDPSNRSRGSSRPTNRPGFGGRETRKGWAEGFRGNGNSNRHRNFSRPGGRGFRGRGFRGYRGASFRAGNARGLPRGIMFGENQMTLYF